jgi:hypothetical protein
MAFRHTTKKHISKLIINNKHLGYEPIINNTHNKYIFDFYITFVTLTYGSGAIYYYNKHKNTDSYLSEEDISVGEYVKYNMFNHR